MFVPSSEQSVSRCTFLTDYSAVLLYTYQHPDETMHAALVELGMRERHVAALIADLRQDGYLVTTRDGRRNHYAVDLDRFLEQRQGVQPIRVRDLLSLFGAPSVHSNN